ncbi:uncharacterized protein ArgRS-m [Ochlerotatus camptorhynchus]|uniref:uncharacterized protein ArgRS-m n=1 Tax=Ochlerotatus camptorhynchus TaxID=644619 RepID=UPI0031D841A3
MTSSYRKLLYSKLAQVIGSNPNATRVSYHVSKETLDPEVHVPVNAAADHLNCPKSLSVAFSTAEPRINHVRIANEGRRKKLILRLCRNEFIENTINDISVGKRRHADSPKTLIEFSSPNIAKPFHAGHLRSAIIGNFLANIYDHLGHDVVKLNYLGDWGTQFGYLKLGVDLKGLTEEDIKRNPIEMLYEAYVYAYKKATDDEKLQLRAREIFSDMEQGRFSDLDAWDKFRSYTVDELRNVYQRLGISFDHFHWESQYGINDIAHVVSLLQSNGSLFPQDDGRKIVKVGNRNVPIVKSDGSTLYLTRDVAALIDRYERFQFSKAIYVVDNSQTDHFAALLSIAQQLDLPYASDISHVKFGRVHGMSTRKGNAVFLKDILDEAENLMRHKQINKTTTKIDVADNPDITAILGTTAVIVNDLKQRRMRDYEFNWDKALQTDGDCGIKLQYTHCRLWSLEKNADECLDHGTCNPELLPEVEALNLICELANYDAALTEAAEKQEACILVNYLFGLCNATNRCIQTLNVKNESSKEKRIQRLKLFNSSRKVLHHGMKLLGLKPLQEM